MAAAVGHFGHDVSTDVVGLLRVVAYVGIRRLHTRKSAIMSGEVTMSIIAGIGAVGSAAHWPN